MRVWGIAAIGLVLPACAAPAAAPPHVPPRDGFTLLDVRAAGPFTIERWVADGSPEVSPAGMCECITVAFLGRRRIGTFGDGAMTAVSVPEPTGKDLDGDGAPDLVVTTWSGGAHCCYSTTVIAAGAVPRTILDLDTGDAPGSFEDLDGDGVLEFVTADTRWGATDCSFAESPFPPVVFAYDSAGGAYVKDTPRFAAHFAGEIAADIAEAERKFADPARDPRGDRCVALRPVLELMYTGRFDEGIALLRRLYAHPDAAAFEAETIEKVRTGPFWRAR